MCAFSRNIFSIKRLKIIEHKRKPCVTNGHFWIFSVSNLSAFPHSQKGQTDLLRSHNRNRHIIPNPNYSRFANGQLTTISGCYFGHGRVIVHYTLLPFPYTKTSNF